MVLVVSFVVFLGWLAIVAAFWLWCYLEVWLKYKGFSSYSEALKRKKRENGLRKVCSGPGDQDQWSAWKE
jgi:hypothetical protein